MPKRTKYTVDFENKTVYLHAEMTFKNVREIEKIIVDKNHSVADYYIVAQPRMEPAALLFTPEVHY